MSIEDEIREKIAIVEKEPESRQREVRLQGLYVLLAKHAKETS